MTRHDRHIRYMARRDLELAKDPTTDALILRALSYRHDKEVRRFVARNKNTDASTLEGLIRDQDADVYLEAAANPNTHAATLDRLAKRWGFTDLTVVAKNPSTSAATLDLLAGNALPEVRVAVARNPNTSVATRDRLAGDEDDWVRRAVAGTQSTPAAILARLAEDEDKRVLSAVAENPNFDFIVFVKMHFGFDARKILSGSDSKLQEMAYPTRQSLLGVSLLGTRFKDNPGELTKFVKESLKQDFTALPSMFKHPDIKTSFLVRLLSDGRDVEEYIINDTDRMFARNPEAMMLSIQQSTISKIADIQSLHDFFDRESRKLKQELFDLPVKPELAKLEGSQFNEELKIVIPKTSHDLIELGLALKLCVGNGDYARRAADGELTILATVDAEGIFAHCIEVSKRGQVKQFKAYGNKELLNNPDFGGRLQERIDQAKKQPKVAKKIDFAKGRVGSTPTPGLAAAPAITQGTCEKCGDPIAPGNKKYCLKHSTAKPK